MPTSSAQFSFTTPNNRKIRWIWLLWNSRWSSWLTKWIWAIFGNYSIEIWFFLHSMLSVVPFARPFMANWILKRNRDWHWIVRQDQTCIYHCTNCKRQWVFVCHCENGIIWKLWGSLWRFEWKLNTKWKFNNLTRVILFGAIVIVTAKYII